MFGATQSIPMPDVYGNQLPLEVLYSRYVQILFQANRRLNQIMMERMTAGSAASLQWTTGQASMSEAPFDAGPIGVTPMGIGQVITNPRNFQLKMAISECQKDLINLEYVALMSRIQGLAASRSVDLVQTQGIFSNASYALNTFKQVEAGIGATTGLNVTKLAIANGLLDNDAVPSMDRMCVANNDQYVPFELDPLYSNSLISNMYPLREGVSSFIKPYLNTAFAALAKNSSAALPITIAPYTPVGEEAPVNNCQYGWAFVLQFEAMTLNYNRPVTTSMWYDGGNLLDNVITRHVTNSNIIQQPGIVLINTVLDPNGVAFPTGVDDFVGSRSPRYLANKKIMDTFRAESFKAVQSTSGGLFSAEKNIILK